MSLEAKHEASLELLEQFRNFKPYYAALQRKIHIDKTNLDMINMYMTEIMKKALLVRTERQLLEKAKIDLNKIVTASEVDGKYFSAFVNL